jgi:hypothetical protein
MSDSEPSMKVIHDSRRWTGDPAMAPVEFPKLRVLKPGDVSWPVGALILVAWMVMFLGFLGRGYCDSELYHASSLFPTHTYNVPQNLKGRIRFVNQTDGQICTMSMHGIVEGAAAFFLLTLMAYVMDFRRRSKA